MECSIRKFSLEDEAIWDRFVMDESANGTFLQTRRFLNYHPVERFSDSSLIIENEKKAVLAVVPAATVQRDGEIIFVSHPGSTYGGPIVRNTFTGAAKTLKIVEAIDQYLKINFDGAVFKLTAPILCSNESFSLDYAFYNLDYSSYFELSTYVDFTPELVLIDSFRQNKKQDVRKALSHKLNYRPLETNGEISMFYELLIENLKKYGAKPVHTLEELLDFKNSRLRDEVSFFGVWDSNRLVAGNMLFYFKQTNTIHTQYLAADLDIKEYSPATALYYFTLAEAQKKNIARVSWGISTENHGKYLNEGLVTSKEGYGSKHSINYTYYKEYKRNS